MPADIQIRFGAAVRARRRSLGLSQEELAGRAGLHRTYVADVERGARNLSLGSIEKLAQALEVPISVLFSSSGAGGSVPESLSVEILLIDNSLSDAHLTLKAFESANLANPVRVLGQGSEALEFLLRKGRYAHRNSAENPEVILLDLKLSGSLSGIEVLRQLKSDPHLKKIPVILLAASQRQINLAECMRMGAAAFLVKPLDLRAFIQILPQLRLHWALIRRAAEHPAKP